MEYKATKKNFNLATAIFDFAVAIVMMVMGISSGSILSIVFAIIFIIMGVFFIRYYERQRRLEKMTDEERDAFFKSGEALLMTREVAEMLAQKQEADGYGKKDEQK